MDWDLRSALVKNSHFWPLPFIFFLAGCLIGWGIAVVWPSPYRAEVTLHVSYNGDSIFRNPDDYKNWQMTELNNLVLAKGTLQDTLSLLKYQEPYWVDIDAHQLESMLSVYWRNTGKWRLVAEAPRPDLADQLVKTWSDVALDKIQSAASHANTMLELDSQVKSVNQAQAEANLRMVELTQIKQALEGWREESLDQDQEASLDSLERWRLQGLVARLAYPDQAGQALFESTPTDTSPRKDYLPWVKQALASANDHIAAVEQQLAILGPQPGELYEKWNAEYRDSHGITAYLLVESLPSEDAAPWQVRPAPTAALVGGLLGLIGWSLVWLALPFYKSRQ